MLKMENQKESICFNFEKDEQKQNFFDKAKKCDIIHNNNSVFLHKILSVKNQTLLNNTLKKNQSEVLKDLNSSSEKKIYKCNSNRTLHRHKTETNKQNSFTNLLSEINFNSPQNNSSSKTNIFSPQLSSPKIIVNKNKNLGNVIQKEKDKDNENLYLKTYFNKDNTHNDKCGQNKEKINLNNEYFLNPEISFSNLYTCKYLRKPVVIKFNSGINPINFNNNNNSFNANEQKINFSMTSLKEESKENKDDKKRLERVKTDERIKPYNFYEKNKMKSELYRSYEDLEKKSMEISKRKMKKKSSYKIIDFKKDSNLVNIKEYLGNYIQKSRSKKKTQNENNKKNNVNKNRNLKNFRIVKSTDESVNSLRSNNIENEKNDFLIKKGDIKYNYWQEQRNFHYNYTTNNEKNNENNENNINNEQDINDKKTKQNITDEKNINNEEKKEHSIKKKNININFIEDQKNENVYNVSLNVNDLCNNFNHALCYNNSFSDKNSFIRKKYGKKNNVNLFDNCNDVIKNNKKEKNRGNITPTVSKKFIEDYKINDNVSSLSYSQSQALLLKNLEKKQIKVNKKNHNSQKKLTKKIKKDLPSILEEEEKIKNEIKNNLIIIKAIDILNKLVISKNKNNLIETFKILLDYSNQMKTLNYSTVYTNISQNSGLKYVKKIIPLSTKFSRESLAKINKNFTKTNIMKKNVFNVEKQKLIILKRKEFGFFERYERCVDFIDNFRISLIKFLLNEKKNKC